MTDAAPASLDATAAVAAAKAALYLRVSTGRQAESDLSIPDQRRQIAAYCVAKGWDVAAEFVEPGNTATDDRRTAFQAMIDAALVKPPTFTVIIVHSFSRFVRELLRTLAAAASVESAAVEVRSFIPKWRPSVDETDNYVSAGAL